MYFPIYWTIRAECIQRAGEVICLRQISTTRQRPDPLVDLRLYDPVLLLDGSSTPHHADMSSPQRVMLIDEMRVSVTGGDRFGVEM